MIIVKRVFGKMLIKYKAVAVALRKLNKTLKKGKVLFIFLMLAPPTIKNNFINSNTFIIIMKHKLSREIL